MAGGLDLAGDVIVVTGAAGGIGAAICAALRAAGAIVIGTDLHAQGEILAQDVTSAADWAALAARIGAAHGRIAGLVNNAACALTAPLAATGIEAWRRVQAVNVESVVLGLQAMEGLLRAGAAGRAGGAAVVNMSSAAGVRGAAFHAAYGASKAAVMQLTRCAAVEYTTLGVPIRVNAVLPGGVATAMMGGIMDEVARLTGSEAASIAAAMAARHPMGRLGQPEEVAGAVVYLCSTAASFVTGSALAVDGGWSAA